jgi:2-isopropylmalate synthase
LLVPTSRKVAHVTGIQVQRNKAIVGKNAFAHEAGIHQDGMLKDRSTYEIMRPEDVGLTETELVLGKHSGRHALKQRVQQLGYHLDDEQLNRLFDAFKVLADRKKTIYDADIEALAEGQITLAAEAEPTWVLDSFHTTAGTGAIPTAAVGLRHKDGRLVRTAMVGCGPVDAVFQAIAQITGVDVKWHDYRVRAVTFGADSQGEATVEAEFEGEVLRGRASSTDILESSAQAFLQVVNKALNQNSTRRLRPTDATNEEQPQEAGV